MQQQFAPPVEQVALAGIHVRRSFVLVYCGDKVSALLLYLAQQTMQFSRILLLSESVDHPLGLGIPVGFHISKREIVAVIVSVGLNLLCSLQVR